MSIPLKFEMLTKGGNVKRFHAHQVHTCVLNSEHGWGVAMILWLICDNPSANLLAHGLFHDCGEAETGDIPSPTKRKYPEIRRIAEEIEDEFFNTIELPNLNKEERRMLKIADYLDMMHFCIQEMSMGNRNLDEVYNTCHEYISEYKPLPVKAIKLILHLSDERSKYD